MAQSVFDLLGVGKPQEETPSERVDRLRQMRASSPGPSVFSLIGKAPEAAEGTSNPKPAEPGILDFAAAMIPQPVKTTVGGVFDLLTRPSAALAGAALAQREGRSQVGAAIENLRGRRKDSFIDVAKKDFGEDSKLATPLGFLGDVAADPLNLIPVGAVTKGLKVAASVVGDVGSKVTPAKVQDVVAGVRDALGEKFVPRYGTNLRPEDTAALASAGKHVDSPEEFRDSLRMFQKERSTIPTRVEQRVIERYRGTTPEQRGAFEGVMEALEAGAGKSDAVDDLMVEQRRVNNDLFDREVAAGVQRADKFNPDYAPHDYSRAKGSYAGAVKNPNSALNARNRFAKGRQDPERTIQEAVAIGAEGDAALAHLTREVTGETAVATGQFVKDAARRFGLPVSKAPESWQQLKNMPMEKPLAEEMSDVAFPAYIAKELDRFYAPREAPSMLGRMYDKALKLWRTQATVLRPGFHSTNMQGNLFNGAFLAGALHPARWVEAAQWPWLKMRGFPDAPRIGRYGASEVDDFMQTYGIGGVTRGFTNELLEEGADKLLLEKLAEPAVTGAGEWAKRKALKFAKHPVRGAAHFGQTLEDFSKRAVFFDQLHKGATLEDAAKTVDRYLFDYADLTDFEKRYARRIFPFYTWMRKNVPLQLQSVLEQPAKYAGVAKANNAIEHDSHDDRTHIPEGMRPEYLQRAGAVQLPSDGANRRFWTPYLPTADLNKVPLPAGSTPLDVARDVSSALSPAIKAPMELVTNRSLFFDRPIYDADLGPMGDRQRIPASLEFLPDALKRLLFTEMATPHGDEFQTPAAVRYAIESASPFTEAVGRATRSATDPKAPNPYQPLGMLTGIRITQRTPQQVRSDKKAAVARTRRTRRKERSQNRKPLTKSEVTRLYERYRQER